MQKSGRCSECFARRNLLKWADSWEQRKFEDAFIERREKTVTENEDTLLSCAINGMFLNSELFGHFRGTTTIGYLKVKKNDLILSAQNLHLGNANVNLRFEHGIISPAYKVYDLNNCEPEFVQAWVKKEDTKNFFLAATTEGASQCRKNIEWDTLGKQTICMPAIKEQATIGSFFKCVDNLITLHQCKVFYKNIIFKNIKFGGLETENDTSWEQRKLGETTQIIMGQSPDGSTYSDFPTDYILVQGNADLENGWVKPRIWTTQKTKYAVAGDLIMSVRAPAGSMGKTAYNVVLGRGVAAIKGNEFIFQVLTKMDLEGFWKKLSAGSTFESLNSDNIINANINLPSNLEQDKIGSIFENIDNLITLHQRIKIFFTGDYHDKKTNSTISQNELFWVYFERWIKVYKDGAIRKVTMDKYLLALSWLKKLIPDLLLSGMDRIAYQRLLNEYAKTHERQTTMDFHHQLKGAILDAVDEGLIPRDPTRKAIIKGKTPREKKPKYLSQFELHSLLQSLELGTEPNWDWLIMLVAKTGMRFSEALAITPRDFDFSHQTLSISKTWDYKGKGGFLPTKNKSSVRKIQIDWQTVVQFSELIKEKPDDEPLFITCKVYNSTVNDVLKRRCKQAHIPTISIHGLRHTHASLLLFAGVTIASVARRLGHSSMTTTQKTYLHIIHELENKDIDLVMRAISSL